MFSSFPTENSAARSGVGSAAAPVLQSWGQFQKFSGRRGAAVRGSSKMPWCSSRLASYQSWNQGLSGTASEEEEESVSGESASRGGDTRSHLSNRALSPMRSADATTVSTLSLSLARARTFLRGGRIPVSTPSGRIMRATLGSSLLKRATSSDLHDFSAKSLNSRLERGGRSI